MNKTALSGSMNLRQFSIVLQQPRFPENIGAAARAMRNMGIHRLIVVQPEHFELERIRKMATHVASDVVDHIEIYPSLAPALAHFHYIVGTSARLGKKRNDIDFPSRAAEKLVALSLQNPVAILFGPEDRGLSNDDLRYCHRLVHIPTSDFSSINLAQAVMIMCHEVFQASLRLTHAATKSSAVPRLASRVEEDLMYAHLQRIFVEIGFINPENPAYWMDKCRRFLNSVPLKARDVRMIRGFCKQIERFGQQRYQEGIAHPASQKTPPSDPV
jgi:tRNA/rRNA methyltransferase